MSAKAVALFAFTMIWGVVTDGNVCFDEIGCLSMSSPWVTRYRQVPEPFPPKELPIKMDFFSRENPEGLLGTDFVRAPMNPSRPTVIITHDHEDDGNTLWMRSLKDAYLDQVDANVVIMDWGSETVGFRYDQAAVNIRVVAKVAAKDLKKSVQKHGFALKDVHLIGEGLGAHLMSYIAKESSGVGRITGLDPSREFFEFQDGRIRLDKTDANFVDVIHTSSRFFLINTGLGLVQPIGHVDFYINIGEYQPGCGPVRSERAKKTGQPNWLNWRKTTRADDCNHKRARDYFLQAVWQVDNCTFWGHKRNINRVIGNLLSNLTREDLRKSEPMLCTLQTCTPLGLKTAERPARGLFFIKTQKTSPYCISERGAPLPKPKEIFRGMINLISSNKSNRRIQGKRTLPSMIKST